ncbi:MAG: acyl CoA:acetate/3-ketoacid CoA transferase [Acidobacteria bacterium]|nr:acyl CoA:acetate/3-ketoacid CoA transferase [Acidobacteriota bacterium]
MGKFYSDKVVTADKAVAAIKDGATICSPIFGLAGWSEEVALAIRKRFLETGHPRDLSIICGSAMGNHKDKGPHVLGLEGLLKGCIGSSTHAAPSIVSMIQENKITAYCLPQGVIVQMYREIAAKRSGMITKVGLGTFVDPRVEAGKMNDRTRTEPDINEVITLGGEEYLWYKPFKLDVALIRGTKADEHGNVTMDKEGAALEALPVAQAVKNSGGIVIVQAEYLAEAGSLNPKNVKVPGVLVDYVVIAENPHENHWQTEALYYEPAFSGEVRVPFGALPELPLDERLFIIRRAALELPVHGVINVGIGVPDRLAILAGHEGASDLLIFTTEVGSIGGVPAGWPNFGMVYNNECFIEHQNQFDWYDGGGLDAAFLGLGETDKDGNINVSKFNGRPIGCGGFINVSQNSKKVVFCGTFTAHGLKVAAKDGRLHILQEGKVRKFRDRVEQITFSGKYAAKVRQAVLYITERAVFELIDGEMTLTEIAPGVNLEKDILAQMDFKPRISPNLKTMMPELFLPKWGRLREILLSKQ